MIALSKKDKQGIIIIFSVIVIAIIIFMIYFYQLQSSKRFDPKTLCPTTGVVTGQVIVLIDKSDKWASNDAEILKRFLLKIYKRIPATHRLTIVAITGKGRETTTVKTLFDMCNPGNDDECNFLYQNCRKIRKKYIESFFAPLQKITNFLVSPSESSYSPLFETIVELIDKYDSQKLNFYIISDLMENGPKFRFYDIVPLSDEIIQEYPISVQKKIFAHLLLIERRRHSRQLINAVKNVWVDYFSSQGIKVNCRRLLIAD